MHCWPCWNSTECIERRASLHERSRQRRYNRWVAKKQQSRSSRTKKTGFAAPPKPATAGDWIAGARVRTLGLAIAPVLVGVGAAVLAGEWHLIRSVLALVVALSLQVGVNFANDYSDGIRGTDQHRVGPRRLTGSGAVKGRTVLIVALSFFGVGALAGLAIVVITQQWWLLGVGALAIVAAWFYTGGRRPYGYFGLGELVAFAFFGPVAVAGTTFINAGTVNAEAWLGGIALGLFAAATLLVNNVRDEEQDRAAGKRTLSVLIGGTASRILFVLLLLVPYVIAFFLGYVYPGVQLIWLTLLISAAAALITLTARTSQELILVLQLVAINSLAYAAVLAAAFAL